MNNWQREWTVIGGYAVSRALNLDMSEILNARPSQVFSLDTTSVRDCIIQLSGDGDFGYVAGMVSEDQ